VNTMQEAPLAQFVDRLTMRYVREYTHPVELVWDAVTMSEHLDAWLVPECRVEPRLGGACSFSWGGPPEGASTGTVTVYEPPRAVQYDISPGLGYLRFELEPIAGGTRLAFTLGLAPGVPGEPEDYPGGDLPAGSDAPWRPGFLAGFHVMLDRLGARLDGSWTLDDNLAELAAYERGEVPPDDLRLIEVYREHVRTRCPAWE
jgi:uncharacterized protein YndB with AHSA1/START domain